MKPLVPYYRHRKLTPDVKFPHALGTSYTPAEMAALYSFPKITPTGATPIIALIELGGGYSMTAIQQQFQAWGLPAPIITDKSIDGAVNSYTGDPSSADVEVVLDICAAAGAYSYCTGKSANILAIFAPNSDVGFLHSVQAVPDGATCGISWGSPEDQTVNQSAMDAAFKAGCDRGVTYCCASGDAGSSDGEHGDHADYPGSSPYVVCCGGTSILVSGGKITNEIPWNQGGGATGGGYSATEPVPSWQQGFVPSGKLRGVPDLCAAADPQTGWQIATFGVIGGTSAVAPFMAAYFAVVNQQKGSPLGLVNPLLYANEPSFRDIVVGNNTVGQSNAPLFSPRFSAGKGWDPASGLGAPVGNVLINAILSGVVPNPPSPPNPVPPSPPNPVPPAPVTQQQIDAIFAALEKQYANNRTLVWVLRVAQHYVDLYLQRSQANTLTFLSPVPPGIITIIDAGFAAAEQAYPQYAMYLRLIQPVVDEILASL